MNRIGPAERALIEQVLPCSAIGSPSTVAKAINDFIARTSADELMITSQIYDHQARLHSYEITADIGNSAVIEHQSSATSC
jgi:alkanesulfonate monooxygenase SsuD/methylene tetrahydromethanopterin reductase-like flavin-dependent oxidoreductase (luciferase family)